MKSIKSLFFTPTAEQLADQQLREAERAVLQHRDLAEYHEAMVAYLETKVNRLVGVNNKNAVMTRQHAHG